MNPGDRVCLIDNPSRVGVLSSDPPVGEGRRVRVVVHFPDGQATILLSSLHKVEAETRDPYLLMQRGDYGGVLHLRGAMTFYRLSGRLANLIYSLNTTNTRFLPYQFKPVLQYLDSPSRGLVIADEVGLGKTVEAGLIWTEVRARQDARRLLVVCPAMLREKWCEELKNRFGVQAEMVDSADLMKRLQQARVNPAEEFALVVSMQGTRPPRGWNATSEPSQSATAKLARFLDEMRDEDPLLDLVVVDEAHYLRNRETQTYRFAALLRPVTDGLVMLSATPIQMRSTDLFNLLNLLDNERFPTEWVYDDSVRANAPIVALRDRLQTGAVTQVEFREALLKSVALRWFDDSEQIQHLLQNLPSDERLSTVQGRSEYADLLDRVNPRAKVVTRTLKRDVSELRVQREPVTLTVEMSAVERQFYDQVTQAVRAYCSRQEVAEGFLLTTPQRQMSSCMAAACEGWSREGAQDSCGADEEMLAELLGDDLELGEQPKASLNNSKASGALRRQLSAIAGRLDCRKGLVAQDSKFEELLRSLKQYWRDYPDKKVVLFAFYRNTLYYLQKRLAESGITGAVLHGGMDKHAVLKHFESAEGPRILLSSEVASEGVDLQFSSLLVNYDLPWNPAKIEQRIGRIDRIGQEASKILIWNLVYKDTLDERVYERLLQRLNIFRAALGSMEEILGREVRLLTADLLSHQLTAEQELNRIEQSAIAAENVRRNQEELDERATELLGHGDFIQNKAKAAFDLGRYIHGEDLYFYVKDYLESKFEGTRVVVSDDPVRKGKLELSSEGRVAFRNFLTDRKLLGKTTILSDPPGTLWFDNQAGRAPHGIEKITQDHPLIRFISERQNESVTGPMYYPTSAAELPASQTRGVPPGIYIYVIIRWTFSGPRDVERLVYEVRGLQDGQIFDPNVAEALVNAAAMAGRDWHGVARQVLDHAQVARIQDDCRAVLEEQFDGAKAIQSRENRDRIREMMGALDKDLEKRKADFQQRIEGYESSGVESRHRVARMERGRLDKLIKKFEEKKLALNMRESIDPRQKEVSSGVIKVV